MNPYDYSNKNKEDVQKIEIVGLDRLTSALEVLAGIKPVKLIHSQMRDSLLYAETEYLEPEEVVEDISQASAKVSVELGDMIKNFELTGEWGKENKE